MPVRVVHLGAEEIGVVEEVRDGGRTLIVAGEAYTLRPVNAHFVRAGQPSYGTRLAFDPPPAADEWATDASTR